MSLMPSAFSAAGPYPKLIPIQPRPIADTSTPLFPNLRFCMTKYQISIGLRHRVDASVWTFAITENMRNFDNTPDIGFQIGWAYSPAFMR